MKALNKAILIVIASLSVLAGLMPVQVATAQPHEDPDAALWVFDGVSLLQKYSEAVDMVVDKDKTGIEATYEQALQANIPGEVRDSVDVFLSSGSLLAEAIPAIKADLEASRAMLSQSRPEDAVKSARAALSRLTRAYAQIQAMETATEDAGRWWKEDLADGQSRFSRAYYDVLEKLLRIRNLLALLNEVGSNLALQADILSAAARGASGVDLADALKDAAVREAFEAALAAALKDAAARGASGARLADVLRDITPGTLPPDVLAQLIAALSKGAVLKPTTLTLAVSPQSVFVGDEVEFRGTLSGGGSPLGGRAVTVLLDGSFDRVLQTDEKGAFAGSLRLPYRYVPTMTLQAIYFPAGADLGSYLGCSSPELALDVLFYATTLVLDVPDRGYPGRDLEVKCRLDHGDSPAPAGRPVILYWDGKPVVEKTVSTQFETTVPLANDTLSGRHKLAVFAPAQGRYASADAGADVRVSQIPATIDLNAQRVLLLPLSMGVTGIVRSDLGPLDGANLTIQMGDWQTTARTASDGSFEANLGTGLSFSLFGSQELSVVASPEEPWNERASSTQNVVVINPVNIVGLMLALVAMALLAVRWVRRRPAYVFDSPVTLPLPVTMRTEPPRQKAMLALQETPAGPRAMLLAVYREMLRLIQGATAVGLGPSRTLREFAQECGPRLGPLAGYFRELTLMVEKLLYSRQGAGQAEAARSTELGQKLKEGLKREGN